MSAIASESRIIADFPDFADYHIALFVAQTFQFVPHDANWKVCWTKICLYLIASGKLTLRNSLDKKKQ